MSYLLLQSHLQSARNGSMESAKLLGNIRLTHAESKRIPHRKKHFKTSQHLIKYNGKISIKQRSKTQLKNKEMRIVNTREDIENNNVHPQHQILDNDFNIQKNQQDINLTSETEDVKKHLEHIMSMVNNMKKKATKKNKKVSHKKVQHGAFQSITNEKPNRELDNVLPNLKENLNEDSQDKDLIEKYGKIMMTGTTDIALRTKIMDNIKKIKKRIENKYSTEKVHDVETKVTSIVKNAPILGIKTKLSVLKDRLQKSISSG